MRSPYSARGDGERVAPGSIAQCFRVQLHQLQTVDARKHRIAERIVGDAVASGNACISFQVIQECLNAVSRKAQVKLDAASARAYLDAVLVPLYRVSSSAALYQGALDLHARWRFAFHDSLIVAAAVEAGCTRLFSEDLRHGQRVEQLTIENPFRSRCTSSRRRYRRRRAAG